jgi:esterase/lipase superfamily enzyme
MKNEAVSPPVPALCGKLWFALLAAALALGIAAPAGAADCGMGRERTAIPIFYVTDRNDLADGAPAHWGGQSDERQHYGLARTSILRSCATLPAAAAPWWQPYVQPIDNHADRYFLIHGDEPYADETVMVDGLRSFLTGLGGSRDVVLFIHGFNQSFTEAGRDAAQFAMDLPFRGASIFYAWPSQDSVGHYDWDGTRLQRAEPNIRELIRAIIDRVGPDHFHIIAHSMGNRATIAALLDLARERGDLGRRITSLTLLSPDIDTIAFARMTEGRLGQLAGRIGLFSNGRDRALAVSARHFGSAPLGLTRGVPFIAAGLTTIDISAVSHGLIRHGDFEVQAAIMREIEAGIAGLPIAARPCLAPEETPSGRYYRIDPQRAGCPATGAYPR